MNNEIPPNAERIAFATSQDSTTGGHPRARWTELAVYYDPSDQAPRGKRWTGVVRGCTTFPGESTRQQVITAGTPERALKLFDPESQLGRIVVAQTEDFADELRQRDRFTGTTDEEALAWLYGEPDNPRKTLERQLADDFGLGARTVLTAMQKGAQVRVPLVEAMKFFDRRAFREARAGRADG